MVNRTTNLLITDDEKDFVEMLSLRLKASGLNVFSAFNGRECLDLLAQEDIDVVILDIKMPGMDGIETLREIKSRSPLVEVEAVRPNQPPRQKAKQLRRISPMQANVQHLEVGQEFLASRKRGSSGTAQQRKAKLLHPKCRVNDCYSHIQ